MPEIYATNPLMQGLKTLGDVGMQNIANREKSRLEAREDDSKKRDMLVKQFESDVSSVEDILSNTDDPAKRQALGKTLEKLKEVYTGSYARELGVADSFSRRIDIAAMTPVKKVVSSGGTSQFERNIAGLPEEQQQRLRLAKAEAETRNPFQKESMKLDAKSLDDLKQDRAESEGALLNLNAAVDAVEQLGPWRQNPIAGHLPNVSQAATTLDAQNVRMALKMVNQTKGAVSDKEMELFSQSNPSTGTTQGFNKSQLRMAQGVLARRVARTNFKEAWAALMGNTEGADDAFYKFAEANPIFEQKGMDIDLLKEPKEIMNDRSWEAYLPGQATNSEGIPPIEPALLDQKFSTSNIPSAQPPAAPTITGTKVRKKYNITTGEFE